MGLFDHLFKPKPEGGGEKGGGNPAKVVLQPEAPAEASTTPNRATFLQPKGHGSRGSAASDSSATVPPHHRDLTPAPFPERKTSLRETEPAAPASDDIVLTLADVLPRIPPHYLHSGAPDLKRELRFHIDRLSSDIARGRAAVPLSMIAALCPDLFHSPITEADDIEIRLPLQKLVEQIGRIRSRPRPAAAAVDFRSIPATTAPDVGSVSEAPVRVELVAASIPVSATVVPFRDANPDPSIGSSHEVTVPPAAAEDPVDAEVEQIQLSLAAILPGVPRELLVGTLPPIDENVRIALPFTPIERQLGGGKVEVSSARFISALPPDLRPRFQSREGVKVPLPLEEIFQNLPIAAAATDASVTPSFVRAQPSPKPLGSAGNGRGLSGSDAILSGLSTSEALPDAPTVGLPSAPRLLEPFAVAAHQVSTARAAATEPLAEVADAAAAESLFHSGAKSLLAESPTSASEVSTDTVDGSATPRPEAESISSVSSEFMEADPLLTKVMTGQVRRDLSEPFSKAKSATENTASLAQPPVVIDKFHEAYGPLEGSLIGSVNEATRPAPAKDESLEVAPVEPQPNPMSTPASVEVSAAPVVEELDPNPIPTYIGRNAHDGQPASASAPLPVSLPSFRIFAPPPLQFASNAPIAEAISNVLLDGSGPELTEPSDASPGPAAAANAEPLRGFAGAASASEAPAAPSFEEFLATTAIPTIKAAEPPAAFQRGGTAQGNPPAEWVAPLEAPPLQPSVGAAESPTVLQGTPLAAEVTPLFAQPTLRVPPPPLMRPIQLPPPRLSPDAALPLADSSVAPASVLRGPTLDGERGDTGDVVILEMPAPTADGGPSFPTATPLEPEVLRAVDDGPVATTASHGSPLLSGSPPARDDGASLSLDIPQSTVVSSEKESFVSVLQEPMRAVGATELASTLPTIGSGELAPTEFQNVSEDGRPAARPEPVRGAEPSNEALAVRTPVSADKPPVEVGAERLLASLEAEAIVPPEMLLDPAVHILRDEAFLPMPLAPFSRVPQEPLQAIFMTEEPLDLPKISRFAAALPGIQACVIATRDQAVTGGSLPEGFDIAALLGLAPRVGEAAGRLPIGSLQHFTLYGDCYSVSFFERRGLSICAVHRARSFVPGVREKLVAIADELSAA